MVDLIDMKASKTEDRLKQKEKEIRAMIERNRYVLPPIKHYRKISRTYTENKLDNQELVNSYIDKNIEKHPTSKKREANKEKQEPLEQISIFLKRTKNKCKSKKLVYYNPDQVRRTSLHK